MNSHVGLQCRGLRELGLTLGATIGLEACVCPLVEPQGCLGAQALATLLALVPLTAPLMDLHHVPLDILLPLEFLPTELTWEVALAAVHVALVALQVAAVGEGLATGITAVNHLSGHSVVMPDVL